MLSPLVPPRPQAPPKTLGPNAMIKIQTAVRRANKTLRRDVSDYASDLRATYGKGHQR